MEEDGLTEDQDDNLYKYVGPVDECGDPHGRGTLYFESGDRFEGKFQHGNKCGKGCFYFEDGSTLQGLYVNDVIHGVGTYMFQDGSYMVGQYVDGDLNGLVQEFYANDKPKSVGHYEDNTRAGVAYYFDEYGSCVFGALDEQGEMSGDQITYVYPDKETSLVGKFKGGELVTGSLAIAKLNSDDTYHVSVDTKCKHTFNQDVSTRTELSLQPLYRDPFEEKRVYVRCSDIEGAGEGLFSKMALDENEVVAFYNGIRLSHDEVDNRGWSLNDNTISLDDDTVIDVPDNYADTSVYCVTLGHKANHSFTPNCEYSPFEHPYLGKIKCICTIRNVEANDELTVAYGYDHDGLGKSNAEAPPWYKDALREHENKTS